MGYNFFNFYNFLTRESSVMLNETPILKFCDKKQFLKFLARINLDLYGWNYAARPVRAKALKYRTIYKAFALTGRVFKIRLKFGTFFSRIIGLTN